MKNSILVTGGAGYIGAHACKALARAGYTPITYDNLVYGHRSAVKWGPLEAGDISDHERLETVMRKYQPVGVMHFAAYAYVGESVEDPAKYYRNNVAGTLTLLETMRDCGIDKIIFSSTCATYGMPEQIPIAENHPQNPINPYGRSKLMIEWILQDFANAYDLKFISLRYFNAAGADPEGEIGEDHDPETHLIPLVLDVALGKRDHLDIFGTDYDTSDGTCIRDYIHVSDLASAHVLSLEYLMDGGESEAFNLGNGNGFSVKEVVAAAGKITGCEVCFIESDRRPGDPSVLIGSSEKIQRSLGWDPVYNSLDTIVESAWAGIEKQGTKNMIDASIKSNNQATEIIIEAGRTERQYWKDMWNYRELLFFLAWRDILVRYKQTIIGILWALIRPLLTMVVLTVVFGKWAKMPSEGVPYPILVFAAMLPWQFFASSFSSASNSLIANTNLISKVYFPRLIIPTSTVIVSFVDFLISVALLLGLMIWYDFWPTWRFIVLPLLIFIAMVASLGAGCWISALNVKYRDFRYVVPFIVQFGLYISPVGFSSSVVPDKWRLVYSLNPMAGVIDGFRWAILGKNIVIYTPGFILSIGLLMLLLFSGLKYFRSMERTFADFI